MRYTILIYESDEGWYHLADIRVRALGRLVWAVEVSLAELMAIYDEHDTTKQQTMIDEILNERGYLTRLA